MTIPVSARFAHPQAGDTPTTGVPSPVTTPTPEGDHQLAWEVCAAALAGQPLVRMGQPRGSGARRRLEYRSRDQRRLPTRVPNSPAAVLIYGADGCCAALHLDLDVGRHGKDAVDADFTRLTAWLDEHLVRWFADLSPAGGRHVYVPLAERMPFAEAKQLVASLARRYPTLDPMPHASVRTGCITVPGTAHKSGGRRVLTTALTSTYEALQQPNVAEQTDRLRDDLHAEIAAWRAERRHEFAEELPSAADDAHQGPAVAGMSLTMLRLASGHTPWTETKYDSASEARQAVLTSAARAGLQLVDVAVQVERGGWAGLRSLYARYRPHQRRRSLEADWRKAQAFVAANPLPNQRRRSNSAPRKSANHRSHTRLPLEVTRGGPQGTPTAADEHRFIRTWLAALRATENHRFPGQGGLAERFALRVLGMAAHQTGTRFVAHGVRSVAIDMGVEFSSAAAVLRRLSDAPDGWIDLVQEGHGRSADTYELRIPSDLDPSVRRLRWAKGRTHGLRPAFRELGRTEALVFEAVETGRADAADRLSEVTGLSAEACRLALATLHAYSLVSETPEGLVAHPDRLLIVAAQVGALEAFRDQLQRYAEQRKQWHAFLARFDRDRFVDDVLDPVELEWIAPEDVEAPPDSYTPPPEQPDAAVTTVYVRPGSGACEETCRYLFLAGLPYRVIDISQDADARDYVMSLGELQVPVVITSRGRRWRGHDVGSLARLAGDVLASA